MNSILNSVALTDENIKLLISDNSDFNELLTIGYDQHQVLRYRAMLMTVPEHCLQFRNVFLQTPFNRNNCSIK